MNSPEQVFLLPGEMHFARKPMRIATLLGSCVAVILHDPHRSCGGMNHFLLPDASLGGLAPGKAGDLATAKLVQLATLAGSAPGDLRATIVGGGRIAARMTSGNQLGGDIGARNVVAARQALERAGIRVVSATTGGECGVRVGFDTASGHVEVVPIPVTADAQRAAALAGRALRVLIVDDSATVRGVLRQVIAGADGLEVCGEAEDPFAARERIMELEPDVICLDVIMPKLDGLSFLTRLMAFRPIPTVIVSTIAKAGSDMERRLLAAGAVAIIDKEELKLYQGLDVCRSLLLPVLRRAARTAVTLSRTER